MADSSDSSQNDDWVEIFDLMKNEQSSNDGGGKDASVDASRRAESMNGRLDDLKISKCDRRGVDLLSIQH